MIIVFGDTLRRLAMFQGTRGSLKRHGYEATARQVCNASKEEVVREMEARVGQPGVCQKAGAELLQQSVPRRL